ncbi:MAG: hypothetical protein JNK47_10930 [Mesorhizobium sp.]|nr:hypothetical protein [Mesorhizobium sp.]MBL8577732.1 hypothetical protein [Mesorhizobium sp.]
MTENSLTDEELEALQHRRAGRGRDTTSRALYADGELAFLHDYHAGKREAFAKLNAAHVEERRAAALDTDRPRNTLRPGAACMSALEVMALPQRALALPVEAYRLFAFHAANDMRQPYEVMRALGRAMSISKHADTVLRAPRAKAMRATADVATIAHALGVSARTIQNDLKLEDPADPFPDATAALAAPPPVVDARALRRELDAIAKARAAGDWTGHREAVDAHEDKEDAREIERDRWEADRENAIRSVIAHALAIADEVERLRATTYVKAKSAKDDPTRPLRCNLFDVVLWFDQHGLPVPRGVVWSVARVLMLDDGKGGLHHEVVERETKTPTTSGIENLTAYRRALAHHARIIADDVATWARQGEVDAEAQWLLGVATHFASEFKDPAPDPLSPQWHKQALQSFVGWIADCHKDDMPGDSEWDKRPENIKHAERRKSVKLAARKKLSERVERIRKQAGVTPETVSTWTRRTDWIAAVRRLAYAAIEAKL